MNKFAILTLTATLASSSTYAQNLVDAVRFGSTDLNGTARYKSMAGAFGALGGDPSSMSANPAGLAIYRGTNVLTFTPNLSFTGTEAMGSKGKDNNFSVANLSGVFSFRTPDSDNLVNFNLGIGIERRQENFRKYNVAWNNPRFSLGDYLEEQANAYLNDGTPLLSSALDIKPEDSNAPLLSTLGYYVYAIDDALDKNGKLTSYVRNTMHGEKVNQAMRVKEKNRHDEYNITASFNFNDVFYLGANLKVTDFNSTILTQFDELYPNLPNEALYYDNSLETKGSGIGLNLGLIWKPTDSWRIGAAVHTPTWMEMKEFYSAYMETAAYADNGDYDPAYMDYNDSWEYDFYTPWEYQLSTAFVLGSRAILSFEWDMRDYRTMEYSESERYYMGQGAFDEINQAIDDRLQMQHTIRVGAEYRITRQLSARAGFAQVSSPYKKEAMLSQVDEYDQYLLYSSSNKLNYNTIDSQRYITAGLGWRGKNWNFDLSCVNQSAKEYVAAYPADYVPVADVVKMDMTRWNWDFTIGYRF